MIGILLTTLSLVSFSLLARLFYSLILEPQRLRSKLQKQGIKGPAPSFLLGNISELRKISRTSSTKLLEEGERVITHDCSALFPFYNQWREQYGSTFNFSVGNMQILITNNPDVVKEISIHTSFNLERSSLQRKWLEPLLGQGILNSSGEIWARQRKIIAPQFYMDNVKGLTKVMVDSALKLVNTWISKIENEGGISDIKVDAYMRSFSADVISQACFGSCACYSEAIEIFSKITALEETLSKKIFLNGIPKIRYLLPTKSNREGWKLEKAIQTLIMKIVEERRKTPDEEDVLQRILEGAKGNELGKDEYSKYRFIVDNCKSLCLAGFESTAMTATWTLMLLALNPEWQNRVRAEIVQICKGELPHADILPKMKTLTMVINETLRLYPPAPAILREASNDIKLGDINVPRGVNVLILNMVLHQDSNIWGSDADKFNPERFADGIGGACKHPHVYVPFGTGPHTCLGQQFAMAELKILLSLILSNFTFSISPKYRHSPVLNFVVQPQHGVNLLVKRL